MVLMPLKETDSKLITCLGKNSQHTEVPLICIVDDDLSVLEAIVGLMESTGYRVVGFSSTADFLEWPHIASAACLLVDVMMPSISGFELHRLLTAKQYRIPTIFITAYDDEDLRVRAFQAGAAGFLLKPFGDEALFQTINSALAKGQADQWKAKESRKI
jgi:FixJ family two-component response regulator